MKIAPILALAILLLVSCLWGCSSSPHSPGKPVSHDQLSILQRRDQLILNSLHEEPQKQGTKEVVKENGITTEIWRSKVGHGDAIENVETLIFKNGKLISHSYLDGHSGFTGSRQYLNDKVIQYTEEMKGKATVIFFDPEENINARMFYDGKKTECIVYDKGKNPRYEDMEDCEQKYNTSP